MATAAITLHLTNYSFMIRLSIENKQENRNTNVDISEAKT